MKHLYRLMAWALLVCPFIGAYEAAAQDNGDVMVVEWTDDDGFPVINALRDAILGDTTATGERANTNRVYQLKRGGFYFLTERITNSGFQLTIVGEEGPESEHLPVIMKLNREDGTIDDKLIVGQDDVTLKNLILNGRSDQGNLPYEAIRLDAANARYTFDNVIFEFAQWGIVAVYGKNSDVFVTNSHFRNLVSHTQKWGGRGMSVWTDVDTLYFENNTFFNVGAVPLQVEGGVANHLWFNHNTLVNVGRAMMWGSWWKDAYITNNLIVNGYWHGEDEGDFTQERLDEPGSYYSGMFSVTPLPSAYGLDIERQIAVVANATFRDQAFADYYASTSGDINAELPDNAFGNLRPQPFINDSTMAFFDAWDNLVFDRHIDGVDPGLGAYGEDNFSDMIQFISDLRAGEAEVQLWYWDPERAADIPLISAPSWPLPEDLSYTNAQLLEAGIGDFPIGDLNWFPAEKAAWTGQQEALREEILDLVAPAGSSVLIGATEAEAATLTGDAATATPDDMLFADLRGGGFIEWTFDLDAAATYDVAVESRAQFGEKYQHMSVNGTQLDGTQHGSSRGEAIHVADNGPDTWFDAVVTGVDFQEGTNTLRITPSWGFSNHRDVKLLDGDGNVVATLAVVDGVRENMALVCDGDQCASGNGFVALGTGSATWNFDVVDAGQYLIRLTYKAEAGQTADVSVNGTQAATVTFGAATDWATVDVSGLMFTSGVNQVELAGASGPIGIDKVDLFQIMGTGTAAERAELPDGYTLGQNYPNPFNPVTTIQYELGAPGTVTLSVFDVLGRKVATLVDGTRAAGQHHVSFDAAQLSSGLYFYRLETAVGQQVRQMVLLK